MADFGMFGAPVGLMARQQSDDAQMLNALKALHTAGEIQAQPAEMDLKRGQLENQRAQAEWHRAQAAKAQAEALAEQRFLSGLDAMANGQAVSPGVTVQMAGTDSGFGGPISVPGGSSTNAGPPSVGMDMISKGQLAVRSGLMKEGREMINTGSLMLEREATGLKNRWQAQNYQSQIIGRQADRAAQLSGSVRDQASYDRARFIAQSEGLNIFDALPPSYEQAAPALAQIYDGSIKAADRARLTLQENDNKSKAANRNSAIALRNITADLRKAQKRLVETREERLAKGGVTGAVTSPNTGEIASAQAVIKREFPNVDDPAGAARGVASEARYLVKANPGLTMDQATMQAFNAAKTRRDFSSTPGSTVFGVEFGKATKYVGGGRTPQTALPIPTDSAPVIGKHYILPDGRVGLRTKEGGKMGYKIIPGVAPIRGPSGEMPVEDLEDETLD